METECSVIWIYGLIQHGFSYIIFVPRNASKILFNLQISSWILKNDMFVLFPKWNQCKRNISLCFHFKKISWMLCCVWTICLSFQFFKFIYFFSALYNINDYMYPMITVEKALRWSSMVRLILNAVLPMQAASLCTMAWGNTPCVWNTPCLSHAI